MFSKAINPERVRELFSYNPATGALSWRQSRGKAKAGDVAGCLKSPSGNDVYWIIKVDGLRFKRSRLVWAHVTGQAPPDLIDHKSRDKLDDRFENLRAATRSQNNVNAVYPKTEHPDLPRGVRPKRRKGVVVGYRACFRKDGRRYEVGDYPTPEKASAALQAAVSRAHGAGWLPS